MDEILRGRRNVLQTMDDSELIRRYRLDRAGIVFVSDLIREKLTLAFFFLFYLVCITSIVLICKSLWIKASAK